MPTVLLWNGDGAALARRGVRLDDTREHRTMNGSHCAVEAVGDCLAVQLRPQLMQRIDASPLVKAVVAAVVAANNVDGELLLIAVEQRRRAHALAKLLALAVVIARIVRECLVVDADELGVLE